MCMLAYYFMYICIFIWLTLFLTSRFSNLGSLIFYFVYLIGYFIFTPLIFFFRLCVFQHFYRVPLICSVVDTFDLVVIVGCYYLVNPLDRICKISMFITYLVTWFWDSFNVFIYFEVIRFYVCCWLSQKGYVFYCFINCIFFQGV